MPSPYTPAWTILRAVLILLLSGLAGAALIRLAPGFGVDEQALDPRLSASSLEALERAQQMGYQGLELRTLGADASVSKLLWSELERSIYETGLEILGPYAEAEGELAPERWRSRRRRLRRFIRPGAPCLHSGQQHAGLSHAVRGRVVRREQRSVGWRGDLLVTACERPIKRQCSLRVA